MAHALCLQPWITLAGNGNTLTQDEADHADLSDYVAAIVYAEVSNVSVSSVTTTLTLDTAPTKDGAFYMAAATYTFAASPVFGVQPLQEIAFDVSSVPLSRHLRWTLVFGAAATEITFRIWLSLLQAGSSY